MALFKGETPRNMSILGVRRRRQERGVKYDILRGKARRRRKILAILDPKMLILQGETVQKGSKNGPNRPTPTDPPLVFQNLGSKGGSVAVKCPDRVIRFEFSNLPMSMPIFLKRIVNKREQK